MKFIDEATIKIYAGDGGNGVATFRREKFRGALWCVAMLRWQ